MSTSTRFRAGTRKARQRPSLRTTRRSDLAAGRLAFASRYGFRILFEDSAQPRRTVRHPGDAWGPDAAAWIAGAGARAKARSDKGREAGERGKRR